MWCEVKLGELFRIGSSKRVLKSQWEKQGIPFYRGREVTALSKYGRVDNELFISNELYKEYSEKYGVPEEGDIVITAIGTIGNSYIVQEHDRFYFKDASVLWLDKTSDVNSEFINYWLKSPWMKNQLDEGNGATVDTLTINKLQNLVVNLPSLDEQQRIVAILDEAFAGIATATANADKNLKNARELFESTLQSVFAEKGVGCEQVTLSNLATDITDGDHSPPPKSPTGVPFITISNIDKGTNAIDFSDTFKVPDDYYLGLKPNKKPTRGDVLYTVTGSFGIPVLINDDFDFCFQRHIGLIRPKEGVNSAWLYYLLMSPIVFNQANHGATGTAQKTVSLKVLRNIVVPKMPIEAQEEIVEILDKAYSSVKQLEAIYQSKLGELAELKQSILQKAFAGELH